MSIVVTRPQLRKRFTSYSTKPWMNARLRLASRKWRSGKGVIEPWPAHVNTLVRNTYASTRGKMPKLLVPGVERGFWAIYHRRFQRIFLSLTWVEEMVLGFRRGRGFYLPHPGEVENIALIVEADKDTQKTKLDSECSGSEPYMLDWPSN